MFFIKNSFYFVKQRFFAKAFVFPRISPSSKNESIRRCLYTKKQAK